jgi:hypothetical protein
MPSTTGRNHADAPDRADTQEQPKDERNYDVELNDFLRGHPAGDLTPFLQYVISYEDRGDAPILIVIVIAKCEFSSYYIKV